MAGVKGGFPRGQLEKTQSASGKCRRSTPEVGKIVILYFMEIVPSGVLPTKHRALQCLVVTVWVNPDLFWPSSLHTFLKTWS